MPKFSDFLFCSTIYYAVKYIFKAENLHNYLFYALNQHIYSYILKDVK